MKDALIIATAALAIIASGTALLARWDMSCRPPVRPVLFVERVR